MKFYVTSVIISAILARANAVIMPPLGDSVDAPQCNGLTIDFTRLQNVDKSALNPISRSIAGREYGVNTIMPVMQYGTDGTTSCVKKRHRLRETVNGVRVYGADVIVTVENCDPPNENAIGGGYEKYPLSGVSMDLISAIAGKTFSTIAEVTNTYAPTLTEEDTIATLSDFFGTPTDRIGSLELTIFPSYEKGDLLSYNAEVWVSEQLDGFTTIRLYDVFISAVDGDVFSICSKMNFAREAELRSKIKESREKRELLGSTTFDQPGSTNAMCGSCASQDIVEWSTTETNCTINSLYFDDTGKSTTCLVGTVGKGTANEKEVLGPGIVSALHYYGTYDCNQRESGCNANELPLECDDALSDVHYGVTKTMEFLQETLGVMGGLSVNPGDPIRTASFVHFAFAYCNAFFTTQTNSLYFGDCDCAFWTPLTSMDVAAHELAHGVTNYQSGLVYAYQPGGLNEGYSDIIGATMEFVVDDANDTPDFTLGENLIGDGDLDGFILRYMENPTQDGKSIDNVCSFRNDQNVHYTSGVPNLAFTSSVRACEASGCGTLRQCVMMLGPLYMYANIQGLTRLSGYLDAAQATCNLSDEFMARKTSDSQCTPEDAKQFVKEGWLRVGVTVHGDCVATTTSGCALPGIPSGGGGGPVINCFKNVAGALTSAVAWLFSPFFGDGEDTSA